MKIRIIKTRKKESDKDKERPHTKTPKTKEKNLKTKKKLKGRKVRSGACSLLPNHQQRGGRVPGKLFPTRRLPRVKKRRPFSVIHLRVE